MKKYIIALILLFATMQANSQGKFEIGDKSFMLNGKPFIIKAAEIHYPRIPHEYWEHRIQMCKSMGMNTICLYLFWNLHEQQEGVFDFTGQNNVREFCLLAQKHGVQIIIRPGPYVCAEWDMGGLPWWLLKKKDIRLRDNESQFLESTGKFMKKVGEQLADLQISNGGNIIMVQVENEYGAYDTNKEYVAKIRDIVKKSGFNGVPLFQCDWSSNFLNNGLDDLVWTINFGTGANIQQQFAKLKEGRPNTPLMCSEFWSGWFDKWGARHETRPAKTLVDGMKEMVDNNISFSLYMAHGGTSFGQWAGANFPRYTPTCTTYDYDAPINEAGAPTEKYYLIRELLSSYLPEGETLIETPEKIKTISVPKFKMDYVAPLFRNLPKANYTEDVKSMEFFDQGWGTIIYRIKLEESKDRQSLYLSDARDWTQVFINGKKIGTISRQKDENSIILPPVKKGDVLDIVVEAMGRVNFGRGIYDYKGLSGSVELKTANETQQLKNWEVFNIPVDYTFVKNREYKKDAKANNLPAFYKGAFNLTETGDTYLNMSEWSKGLVWVNGYCLGRYWEVGPQQTLFLPGCWLKKGENEVIVFDVGMPVSTDLEGLNQPILDVVKGINIETHRKEGETLNLSAEKPYYSGTFKPGNGWQHVQFSKAVKARYICLESLNSHGGDNYAAIAELEVSGSNRKPMPRDNWKIVYADSEEVNVANNNAAKVFDLQESTYWHTTYSARNKPEHPHQIVIDLGEEITISGFSYLPRAEEDKPGMIKDYNIYVKKDKFTIK